MYPLLKRREYNLYKDQGPSQREKSDTPIPTFWDSNLERDGGLEWDGFDQEMWSQYELGHDYVICFCQWDVGGSNVCHL